MLYKKQVNDRLLWKNLIFYGPSDNHEATLIKELSTII